MDDMSFLDDDEEPKAVAPGIMNFDATKADLVNDTPRSREFKQLPFVQEAIKYAQGFGFEVVENLQAVFGKRNLLLSTGNPAVTPEVLGTKALEKFQPTKAVTVREAEILYRRQTNLANRFLQHALFTFASFITESTDDGDYVVFYIRYRYNRALDWLKANPNGDPARTTKAKDGLRSASESLAAYGFPLHDLEVSTGFHLELLKPEDKTFRQFFSALPANPAEREKFADPAIYALFRTFILNSHQ